MADFEYEIVKELGVLSTSPKGWTKEVMGELKKVLGDIL